MNVKIAINTQAMRPRMRASWGAKRGAQWTMVIHSSPRPKLMKIVSKKVRKKPAMLLKKLIISWEVVFPVIYGNLLDWVEDAEWVAIYIVRCRRWLQERREPVRIRLWWRSRCNQCSCVCLEGREFLLGLRVLGWTSTNIYFINSNKDQ